jgi:hypothetical protein
VEFLLDEDVAIEVVPMLAACVLRLALIVMAQSCLRKVFAGLTRTCQNVFGKSSLGSIGEPPVPSGDSPDGTATSVCVNEDGLLAKSRRAVPVGGSPTGAGKLPALPIFQTRSQRRRV